MTVLKQVQARLTETAAPKYKVGDKVRVNQAVDGKTPSLKPQGVITSVPKSKNEGYGVKLKSGKTTNCRLNELDPA